MSGDVRGCRPQALLAVAVTLAAVVATVVASPPGTTRSARPPATGATAAIDRAAAAHPAIAATPAPVVPEAVAGAADPAALYVLYAASARGAGPAHLERVSRLAQERVTGLSCADPMSGRVRATWASPPPERVVAAEPTRVAVVAGGRLLMFPTDARCRPGRVA
jgi:hypothetical protein